MALAITLAIFSAGCTVPPNTATTPGGLPSLPSLQGQTGDVPDPLGGTDPAVTGNSAGDLDIDAVCAANPSVCRDDGPGQALGIPGVTGSGGGTTLVDATGDTGYVPRPSLDRLAAERLRADVAEAEAAHQAALATRDQTFATYNEDRRNREAWDAFNDALRALNVTRRALNAAQERLDSFMANTYPSNS
jgi:hypothetical protein